MKKEARRTLMVVLGMHRSGTSAVTKSLEVLGIGLGDDFHPAGFDNPKGFWEDRECLAINEALLQHLDSAYDKLAIAWPELPSDSVVSELRVRAVRIVASKLAGGNGSWGFKDPRTCRLLRFWSDVFAAADCDVRYVIVLRNPLEVAASLAERNKLPAEKSYYLWLQHTLGAVAMTAGQSRVLVDYEFLLREPVAQLARMAEALGLREVDGEDPLVRNYAENFLDVGLRHTSYGEGAIALDVRVPPDVASLYELLRKVARDQLSLDSPEVHASISALELRLKATAPAFSYINALEDERGDLWARLAELDATRTALFDQLSHVRTELQVATNERDARNAEVSQRFGEYEAQVAALSKEVGERDAKIAELAQVVSELDARVIVLVQGLAELESQIDILSKEMNGRDTKIVGLTQELVECEARAADLTQALSEREVRLSMQSHAIAERDARIHDLLRSTSWRVTEPMRMLKRLVRQEGGRRAVDSQTMGRRGIRAHCSKWVRAVYRRAPIRIETKIRIKGSLYAALPTAFSGTKGYQDWARHMKMLGAPVEQRYEQSSSQESSGRLAPVRVRVSAVEQDDAFVGEARLFDKVDAPVTLVAFYLPQFHPIAENDAWWGRGFTEWTNVSRAVPQFEGHYQPHLPAELGFYDLRLPEVQARQVELAKGYGVGAFCFYFYWFGGKTLLEAPIAQYHAHPEFDLPFCLCWANENWSRRWDGLDAEVLIGQDHSPEDDLAFIAHIAKYLRDPRYLRIDGRPVLLLYRPSLLPDARATAMRWRQWAREAGIGELYLVYPQSFETADPAVYGFDAATEFPPNLSGAPVVTDSVKLLNPDFAGIAYDWTALVERSEQYAAPDYKLFRGVCPSWDNEARRTGRGAAFVNSNPADYERWLRNAVDDTCARFERRDERLVFVNAWNEWAEGAHLEPDRRYGYAWLEATRRALTSCPAARRKIVIVTHDAHPHGAQYLALHMAEEFAASLKFEVTVVCLGDGILKESFAKVATLVDLAGVAQDGEAAAAVARRLHADGFEAAIVNTTASGRFLPVLQGAGLKCVSLIHELESVIEGLGLREHAELIAAYADAIVFPAREVRDSFVSRFDVPESRIRVRHQGLYKRNRYAKVPRPDRRERLRAELGISPDAVVVLGVGYADHRKGIDLFVEAALKAALSHESLHFVWVGHWCQEMTDVVASQLKRAPDLRQRFHFVGRRDDTDLFYAGADLFALTSREDPFPSVVMEAMEVGLPIVGFEGGGGFVSLLREGAGCLVPMGEVQALADVFVRRALNPDDFAPIESAAPIIIQNRFSFRHYLYDLSDLAGCRLDRVSVVVPNFNYARFLPERLASIANQDYPIYELIVLDDASTDNSLVVAEDWLGDCRIDARLVCNPQNSGSVFAQWKKGVELACGDFVWIAEADDLAEEGFLSEVLHSFLKDPGVVLGYCESKQMGQDGKILDTSYQAYVSDISKTRWSVPYVVEGVDEVREALCIKNTVPNVSAVVFKKNAVAEVLEACERQLRQFKVAGDWFVYANLAKQGKIAFSPLALNLHRRHDHSVTLTNFNIEQLAEIVFVQEWIARTFGLAQEKVKCAKKYAQDLYEQFGLISDEFPRFEQVINKSRSDLDRPASF